MVKINGQVLWSLIIDEIWSAVYLGVCQASRLLADRCASHKQDGDTRQTRGFIQVRPPRRHNSYVLRLIVLLYVNERCFLEGSPIRLI
jgi:hypothetical protein